MMKRRPFCGFLIAFFAMATSMSAAADSCPSNEQLAEICPNIVSADVVALDQPFFFNRLGASQANGQIFALRSDVVCVPGSDCQAHDLTSGNVMLRTDKRPRPMVLRVSQGDCLRIDFENLLSSSPDTSVNEQDFQDEWQIESNPQTTTRDAGVHVMGLPLVAACDGDAAVPAIGADASFVGTNDSSLASPGESRTYVYRAEQEGGYLLQSSGANAGLLYGNGQIALGLHGMVNVEPPGAVYFRSQVSRDDLYAAARRDYCPPSGDGPCRTPESGDDCPYALTSVEGEGDVCLTPLGQPVLDYWAKDASGRPILAMVDEDGSLWSTDVTAIIAYQAPDAEQPGPFPFRPEDPLCFPVPAATGGAPLEQRCTQPFREITTIYQEPLAGASQTMPCITGTQNLMDDGSWQTDGSTSSSTTTITVPAADGADSSEIGIVTASQTQCPTDWNVTPYLADVFSAHGSLDSFAINYGMDAMGPRLLANRVRIGPQGDCVGCKYEEFFLSSWPNGDPAQVSTAPAGLPSTSQGAAEVIRYPDDPSSVYHSYIRDPVKFRIASAGGAAAHVHHQHAHQWLQTPNASSAHYLDSQTLTPGATHTLEMVYHGSGNRNETVGDSIFHCHFYPHFASGMWSLWRVHDVYEDGTRIDPETGLPVSAWTCVTGDDGDDASGEPLDADECRQLEADHEAVQWRLESPNRALPDPTIADGTPIPALVPLPALAMPPMPAPVALSPDGKSGLTLIADDEGYRPLSANETIDPARAEEIGNPGFPFFIPGLAGQRAVRPPMDVAQIEHDGKMVPLDGGLPRHRIGSKRQVATVEDASDIDGCTPAATGNTFRECHTRHDFSKVLLEVDAESLDDEGVPAEKLAMLWHGELFPGGRIPSCDSLGLCDETTLFRLNGNKPVAGAPYADPCAVEDRWNGSTRHYKAAAIQTDVVLSKEGWHFPQQRMMALWQDVESTLDGTRAPEPLFFRANSRECIDFWHTNLVPSEYALDDYQVRTPTDIIGQHIHLVKFDVTSSDGAANGFNYEDATFSPDEVRERIAAINARGGLRIDEHGRCPDGSEPHGGRCMLAAKNVPFFGDGPGGAWIGAMATVQRWMADPQEDIYGDDRTLRTVFTHDHLSPSTHQQTGLYGGLLVEPECSQWVDSWTGETLGGSEDPLAERCVAMASRPFDGGPTSWRANILFRERDEQGDFRLGAVREFALEFQDMALTYPASTERGPAALGLEQICPSCPGPDLEAAIGPSSLANKFNYGVDFPRPLNSTPVNAPVGPWPQAVSFGAMFGAYAINYRSEPLVPRVTGRDGSPPPASGARPANRDYAQVYRSIERERPELNIQPTWYPPLTGGVEGQDPYTPLLEAYAGDRVQIRTLTGAHFLNHQFTLRGLTWLFEPSLANSGYRASQSTSLSEHFEMNITLPAEQAEPRVDYLYQTDSNTQAQAKGAWGLMRVYDQRQDFLEPLPDNIPHDASSTRGRDDTGGDGRWVCSPSSLAGEDGFSTRRYRVLAIDSHSFVDGTPLPYRSPVTLVIPGSQEPLETAVESPEAILYVLADHVEETPQGWRFKDGRVAEPLVLRAAAGDCLEVILENHLDPEAPAFVTANPTVEAPANPLIASADCTDTAYLEKLEAVRSGTQPTALDGYGELCAGSYAASTRVGLAPQLVSTDALRGSGHDVGGNPSQTVPARPSPDAAAPSRTYYWYAGHVETSAEGERSYEPVEFGAANLLPADPLFQHSKGLFGALIIEPRGARWVTDAQTDLQATVQPADGEPFREGVLLFQDDLELYFRDQDGDYQALNVANLANFSGQTTAVNYGAESPLLRMAPPAAISLQPAQSDGNPSAYGQLPVSDLVDQSCWFSSRQYGRDPSTTVLAAHAGTPYRLRLLHPNGNFTPQTFVLHGHGWQQEPYTPLPGRANSGGFAGPGTVPQTIGPNPFSQWMGSQGSLGSMGHYDIVLAPVGDGEGDMRHNGAGGSDRVPGDYLYRSWQSNGFTGGTWGLFRVGPAVPAGEQRDIVAVIQALESDDSTTVLGKVTSILGSAPGEPRFADSVTIHAGDANGAACDGEVIATVTLDPPTGGVRTWSWTGDIGDADEICVLSSAGGLATGPVMNELPCPSGASTSNSTADSSGDSAADSATKASEAAP